MLCILNMCFILNIVLSVFYFKWCGWGHLLMFSKAINLVVMICRQFYKIFYYFLFLTNMYFF